MGGCGKSPQNWIVDAGIRSVYNDSVRIRRLALRRGTEGFWLNPGEDAIALSTVIIADAGPPIILTRIGHLETLQAVFDQILVPEAVARVNEKQRINRSVWA